MTHNLLNETGGASAPPVHLIFFCKSNSQALHHQTNPKRNPILKCRLLGEDVHFTDHIIVLFKQLLLLIGQCTGEFIAVSAHEREQVLELQVLMQDRSLRLLL